jgi:endonuclease-8
MCPRFVNSVATSANITHSLGRNFRADEDKPGLARRGFRGFRRLRARGRDAISDALLNQRVVAGIGNVFKSEILFLAGIAPFTLVSALSDGELDRLVDTAREQLAANVMSPSQTLSSAIGRRTTRSLDPREKLWVYSRGGKPCRRCGSLIQSRKAGPDARLSYWCPTCQATPVPHAI